MSEKERIEAAEKALFESGQRFRALRSVAFLMGQAEGAGPFEWTGPALEDLEALLSVIADRGAELADEALEGLQGIGTGKLQTA
jgi:hypothetical protein